VPENNLSFFKNCSGEHSPALQEGCLPSGPPEAERTQGFQQYFSACTKAVNQRKKGATADLEKRRYFILLNREE
jgi:hypothetical protein